METGSESVNAACWSFSGFDDETLRVFQTAREEAQRLKHHAIFVEHLLIAMVKCTDLLQQNGLDANQLRSEIESQLSMGSSGVQTDKLCFGPRAKYILGLALIEARQLGHDIVSRDHLLLALIQDDGGTGEKLRAHGLDADSFRIKLAKTQEDLRKLQSEVQQTLRSIIER